MGIREDNHQYMITRHSDKKHDHHHVLANRVGMDRKVIDYSHSIPRLEKSIDKVEKEMKLNNDLSKTRRYVFDEKNEKGYKVQKENFRSNREKVSTKTKSLGVAEKKDYIKNSVEKSLQESKSVSDLQSKLQEKNISVEARFDKANKLTGISFKYDNLSVKGSAMGKEFKASGIEKEIKNNITEHLEIFFAPTITLHGVMIEVYGFGVLLKGKSGIGKSETALELIHRGHRLIADDMVKLTKFPDGRLVGKAEKVPYFMEIRGLGIIDIKTLYGLGSIRESKKIDLVLELKEMVEDDYMTKADYSEGTIDIMGENIRKVDLYISSGRNAASMVEIATMRLRAKKLGYDSENEFERKVHDRDRNLRKYYFEEE